LIIKCRLTFKILLLAQSQGKCLCIDDNDFHLTVATLPCEIRKFKIITKLLLLTSQLICYTWSVLRDPFYV